MNDTAVGESPAGSPARAGPGGADPATVQRVVADPARLAALRATGLLDAPAEAAFERLAALAGKLLRAPLATVTLVDADRQFYAACVGLPEPLAAARETPLDVSFCRLTVADAALGAPAGAARSRALLAIGDTRRDPRTRDMASVTDFGVHAYAGVALVVDGQPVGTLCVMDLRPRDWTADDLDVLAELGDAATTEIELRAVNRRLVDAQGEAQALVAALRRERHALTEANDRLAASEARYRGLFTSIDDGFAVIEVLFEAGGDGTDAAPGHPVDYRFLETNPGFERQSGLVHAVGRTARELVPGIEAHWIEAYGHVAATGEEMRFQLGSGAMGRWFDVFAFRIGDPAARQVAILFADVTAARVAEHERAQLVSALQVERERLADVFRQAPSFLVVLRGPDHVVALANDAYTRLVGHRALVGRPIDEALPEVRAQGFIGLLDGVLATGEPFVGRGVPVTLARTPDGPLEERFVDFVYLPLVEGDGTRAGVIAHGTDVTEQVRARREVERLLDESEAARAAALAAQDRAEAAGRGADAANQAKSAFLATMSHELRTPINAMIGYTELLELGIAGPLTDQQRGYLGRLTGSSQHLLGLVNDVLDLSKIEAGETRVVRQDATTGPALRAALDLIGPQANGKGVRLVDARTDEDGAPFVGDENRVRQIALNLLGNAVKFTPRGGTVTVSTGTAAEAPAGQGTLPDAGPWAYVRVVDTGVGIAADDQGRIFDPFHQVDGRHTRREGGTGLGLAISRRLARLMGGDLTVASAPRAGATFTLWLPAARDDAARAGDTAADRGRRAERHADRDAAAASAPSLGEVGKALRGAFGEVLAAYADRLRVDPAMPCARTMRRVPLEDHALSLLADLSQTLVIVDDAGDGVAELLGDSSAIQRTVAETHGARRHAQGWDETALRRDLQVFREEVERAVRSRLRPGRGDAIDAEVDAAVVVLLGFVDRAEAISVRAWHRAAARSESGPRPPARA